MLSRRIPLPRAEEREHLVIELKRPSVNVDSKIINQLESYAFAVADDERFKDTRTKWVFWGVSNGITDSVRRKAHQRNRPEGLIHDDEEGRITIWAKTWSQIIADVKGRLGFLQKQLQFAADRDSARAYLQKAYDKYIPDIFKGGGR